MGEQCFPCSSSWLICSLRTVSPGKVFTKASSPGVMGLQIVWASSFSCNWGCHIGAFKGKPMSLSLFHRESDVQGGRCQWKGTWWPDTRSFRVYPVHSHPQTRRHKLQDTCLASVAATFFSQFFCQVWEQAQRGKEVNHADNWKF